MYTHIKHKPKLAEFCKKKKKLLKIMNNHNNWFQDMSYSDLRQLYCVKYYLKC